MPRRRATARVGHRDAAMQDAGRGMIAYRLEWLGAVASGLGRMAEEYWKYADMKLGVLFRFKDTWKEGSWLNEAEGYDEVSGTRLKAFIALSLSMDVMETEKQCQIQGKMMGYQRNNKLELVGCGKGIAVG
ncbi:hypothetical protein Cni_G23003 [Canna indica]|uniref:Uncharacterized protein n=1 Tax=Canna indica TaxID=4628 RepID=A0AAQ3KSL5_9LILI|nr:hypothetical protein Cni_G23003 [Canna indica]